MVPRGGGGGGQRVFSVWSAWNVPKECSLSMEMFESRVFDRFLFRSSALIGLWPCRASCPIRSRTIECRHVLSNLHVQTKQQFHADIMSLSGSNWANYKRSTTVTVTTMKLLPYLSPKYMRICTSFTLNRVAHEKWILSNKKVSKQKKKRFKQTKRANHVEKKTWQSTGSSFSFELVTNKKPSMVGRRCWWWWIDCQCPTHKRRVNQKWPQIEMMAN